TANAMREDEKKCLESGCDDYLSKPLARATLVNTLAYYTQEVSRAELKARRSSYRGVGGGSVAEGDEDGGAGGTAGSIGSPAPDDGAGPGVDAPYEGKGSLENEAAGAMEAQKAADANETSRQDDARYAGA